MQVLLKLCSQLAATRHFAKAACAVDAAYMLLQCMQTGMVVGVGPGAMEARTTPSLAASSAAVAQQLQQSGLLQHLPTLLTDAAHLLQAVAGVWPVSAAAADTARFEHVLRVCPEPAEFAEWQAINTQQLLIRASQLAKVIMAGSQTGTCCLRAAEHLVLASWQYLSTVLQDSPRSQRSREFGTTEHFIPATNAQQQLTNSSTGLGVICLLAGSEAHKKASSASASSSTGAAPSDQQQDPGAGPAHPAVFSRQHVECVALCMVILQLTLHMRSQQDKHASSASTNTGHGSSTPQQSFSGPAAAVQVPAPLHKLLQQLGVSSSAAVWALVQSSATFPLMMSSPQIEAHISSFALDLMNMSDDGQEFMLSSTPESLPQLLMLLPAVLLQWVVDFEKIEFGPGGDGSLPMYSYNCVLACWASCSLIDTYTEVLRGGPASLYQHMTGQVRPQAQHGASMGFSSCLLRHSPKPASLCQQMHMQASCRCWARCCQHCCSAGVKRWA